MVTIQQIITDTERLLASKEKDLAFLTPDNYRAAEFLDERQAAYRRASIGLLRTNIMELKLLIRALKEHVPAPRPMPVCELCGNPTGGPLPCCNEGAL